MSNKQKWKREFSFVRRAFERETPREEFISGSWLIFIGGEAVQISNYESGLEIERTNQTPEDYNRQKGFEALNQPRTRNTLYLANLHFKKSRKQGFKLP